MKAIISNLTSEILRTKLALAAARLDNPELVAGLEAELQRLDAEYSDAINAEEDIRERRKANYNH